MNDYVLREEYEALCKELADMKRADWKVAHIKDLEGQLTERRDRVDDLAIALAASRKWNQDLLDAACETRPDDDRRAAEWGLAVFAAYKKLETEFEAYKVNYEYNAVDLDMAVECQVKERDAARKELVEAKAALARTGVCMSCWNGLPIYEQGCTDCLNTGWRDGRPPAEVALEAANTRWRDMVDVAKANGFDSLTDAITQAVAAKARIASLMTGADRYWEERWREANARIAELEKALDTVDIVLADRHAAALDAEGETARAERAEARVAELEDQLSSTQTVRKMNAAVADLALANTDSWKTRAERVEAECKAMREALEPFANEYDPDLPFWSCRDDNSMLMWDGLASDLCRGDFVRARAALNPSPAARDHSQGGEG